MSKRRVWVEKTVQIMEVIPDREHETMNDKDYMRWRKREMALKVGEAIVEQFGEWEASRSLHDLGTTLRFQVTLMYPRWEDA